MVNLQCTNYRTSGIVGQPRSKPKTTESLSSKKRCLKTSFKNRRRSLRYRWKVYPQQQALLVHTKKYCVFFLCLLLMHKRIANNTSFALREKAWGTRQHYDRDTPQLHNNYTTKHCVLVYRQEKGKTKQYLSRKNVL